MVTTDDFVEHEPRPMPAEFQYLLVVAALFALLLLAGVPGRDEPVVSDGSLVPDRAWTSTWATRAQALQGSPALPASGAIDAPEGAGDSATRR
jgi:hypothetical protein